LIEGTMLVDYGHSTQHAAASVFWAYREVQGRDQVHFTIVLPFVSELKGMIVKIFVTLTVW